jgi:hypothetical protein
MDYLRMQLYKVLFITSIIFAGTLYLSYILWVGDPVSRTWKKWLQHMFKVLAILVLLMGIYVIQGPIRDVIDFKPVQKVITVKDAGSPWTTALFFTVVTDINDESYYLFEGRKFSLGQKLWIIYAPHSRHILYYERIPKK